MYLEPDLTELIILGRWLGAEKQHMYNVHINDISQMFNSVFIKTGKNANMQKWKLAHIYMSKG